MSRNVDENPAATMVFFRDGRFYQIQGTTGIPLKQQAEDHALINPGVTKVEDIHGNILWSLQ